MNIFAHIKSKLSILEVINSYTTLKKAGLYWKGHCPFHSEKTASFTVSPHKDIFYCFGCHTSGDLVSFISQIENCSPLEAAQFLADRYNIELPTSVSYTQNTQKKKRYFEICTIVADWCHKKLLSCPPVLRYLASRSIEKRESDYFHLGYLPGGPQALRIFIKQMAQNNILVEDLIQSNILVKGKRTVYSPFEERIIFPIQDHIGRYCGFGGRTFKPNDDRPKYYNSRENDYFIKGSLLFGLDLAKKRIQKTEIAFLVEGYTDCIAMIKAGYHNTIATLGTSCTEEHLKILSRYTQELIVLFDGDKAGQHALVRLASLCWQVTLDLKIIPLPTNEDPASFLEKGGDLASLINDAQDIFSFFVATLAKDFATKPLMVKLKQAKKMIDVLHKIDDPLKRDILLQRASEAMQIPFSSLQAAATAKDRETPASTGDLINNTDREESEANSTPNNASQAVLVNDVFCAIMNDIAIFNKLNVKYLLSFFPPQMQKILMVLNTKIEKEPSGVSFSQFFDELELNDRHYVSQILLKETEEKDDHVFEYLIMQLQKRHWKAMAHAIKKKIERAKQENNQEHITQLLQDFMALKKKMVGKNLI